MFSRALAVVFCLGLVGPVIGQDVKVQGRFYADSIKIGETVPFSLTAHYPADQNVLFPDSSFSFAPFELQYKKYFSTRTRNAISYDSAVYFLATYEIDSVQKLQLPVFVVHPRDCTAVYSNTSSVVLAQLVKAVPDSVAAQQLPLKTNTDYLSVRWLLNYPVLLIAAGIILVLAIVVWLVFGKRIRRYLALRRLTKNHLTFLAQFSSSVSELNQDFSAARAESVFTIWKKYMEKLVARPYTKYTSKEILQVEHDETLRPVLQTINRSIYAGIEPSSGDPFDHLKAYTEQQFAKKIEQLRHG